MSSDAAERADLARCLSEWPPGQRCDLCLAYLSGAVVQARSEYFHYPCWLLSLKWQKIASAPLWEAGEIRACASGYLARETWQGLSERPF